MNYKLGVFSKNWRFGIENENGPYFARMYVYMSRNYRAKSNECRSLHSFLDNNQTRPLQDVIRTSVLFSLNDTCIYMCCISTDRLLQLAIFTVYMYSIFDTCTPCTVCSFFCIDFSISLLFCFSVKGQCCHGSAMGQQTPHPQSIRHCYQYS